MDRAELDNIFGFITTTTTTALTSYPTYPSIIMIAISTYYPSDAPVQAPAGVIIFNGTRRLILFFSTNRVWINNNINGAWQGYTALN